MSVYFAAAEGYVKVGYSSNVMQRFVSLPGDFTKRPDEMSQTAKIEVLGWFPGTPRDELLAHAALNDHWVAGEWYVDHPDVHDYLVSQPNAVVTSHMSARAMFAVLADRMSIPEARAAYPVMEVTA